MTIVSNGTAPHKKELTWEQVATGNFPPHQPTADEQHLDYFRQAVSKAAASLAENTTVPMAPDRVQKAMDLVLTGAVEAHPDGTYIVRRGNHMYRIADSCMCEDSQRRSRYCKHYIATMILYRAQESMQMNGNGHHPDPEPQPSPSERTPLPAPADANDCAKHWTDVLAPVCHTVKYVVMASSIARCFGVMI